MKNNLFMPKGIKGFRKGHPVPKEIREKLSIIAKGRILTEKHKLKISKSLLGIKRPPMSIKQREQISKRQLGRKLSLEWKKNIGKAQKGKPKHSVESRRKIGLGSKGEKSHFWKGGITPVNEKIRKSLEYKLWREAVFTRDKHTCIWCGQKGGELNADHIKPFALYPELRFAIDNGRTLCKPCHLKTDTWGGKSKRRDKI